MFVCRSEYLSKLVHRRKICVHNISKWRGVAGKKYVVLYETSEKKLIKIKQIQRIHPVHTEKKEEQQQQTARREKEKEKNLKEEKKSKNLKCFELVCL